MTCTVGYSEMTSRGGGGDAGDKWLIQPYYSHTFLAYLIPRRSFCPGLPSRDSISYRPHLQSQSTTDADTRSA